MLEYTSISELCQAAQEQGVSLSQLVLADQAQQMELSPQQLLDNMQHRFTVMPRRRCRPGWTRSCAPPQG